jgi:hypothetical protein
VGLRLPLVPEVESQRAAPKPAPSVYPPDYEQRTLDFVRKVLDDVAAWREADMQIMWAAGAPVLWLVFRKFAETSGGGLFPTAIPAFCFRLVSISRSKPLAPGRLIEGEELKRCLRDAIELYMHKHGIRIPTEEQ